MPGSCVPVPDSIDSLQAINSLLEAYAANLHVPVPTRIYLEIVLAGEGVRSRLDLEESKDEAYQAEGQLRWSVF